MTFPKRLTIIDSDDVEHGGGGSADDDDDNDDDIISAAITRRSGLPATSCVYSAADRICIIR